MSVNELLGELEHRADPQSVRCYVDGHARPDHRHMIRWNYLGVRTTTYGPTQTVALERAIQDCIALEQQ